MSDSIYSGLQIARNGTSVPVFKNGRTFLSAYNPERDAENFITAHNDAFSGTGCILTGGIGNGLHIELLLQKYKNAKIIAFEADEESLAFSLSAVSKALLSEACSGQNRLILTCAEKLQQDLLTNYIPALDGNFAFAAVRSWSDYLGEKAASFITLINNTISEISADYSVQAQFGKLWHRNILINLSLYDTINPEQIFDAGKYVPHAKKAAITGAGPSLDTDIPKIRENRSEYCIFATDTSFSTLTAAGITPDFVVTVDSQQISEKHFVGQSLKGTVLACDLTGNCSIVENAIAQNASILLFHNNHPLSQLADSWLDETKNATSPFPLIDSGAGTVLHAATDLARKLGFTNLSFFGADFSYSQGKPYVKGTYLEKLYYAEEARTGNAQTAYSRLMYRTPLIQLDEQHSTTEVLSRYKNALESFLKQKPEPLNIAESPSKLHGNHDDNPLFQDFIPWYLEKLQKNDKKVLFSLLPLAAWYKKNNSDADTECVYAFAEQLTANVGRIQCRRHKK